MGKVLTHEDMLAIIIYKLERYKITEEKAFRLAAKLDEWQENHKGA